jgi:hypothetical protein
VGFDEDRVVCLLLSIPLVGRGLCFVEQTDLLVADLLALPTEASVLEQTDVLAKGSELLGLGNDQRRLLVELMQLCVDLLLLTKREFAERLGVVGKLDGSDRHDDV